jgi:nitrogen-specific signal transduction histidine kinase
MANSDETRLLLHDIRGRCASLKSAADMLKNCPPEQAAEMADLMTEEARQILQSLLKFKQGLAKGQGG